MTASVSDGQRRERERERHREQEAADTSVLLPITQGSKPSGESREQAWTPLLRGPVQTEPAPEPELAPDPLLLPATGFFASTLLLQVELPSCAVLYYIVLYYIVLYCTLFCSTILGFPVLY